MIAALIVLLALHGAIHLVGFARAFNVARLSQVRMSIDRRYGLLWLAAAIGFVAAAVLLVASPDRWWMAAVPALVASQIAIVRSWSEAKLGTVANAIVLAPLLLHVLDAHAH